MHACAVVTDQPDLIAGRWLVAGRTVTGQETPPLPPLPLTDHVGLATYT